MSRTRKGKSVCIYLNAAVNCIVCIVYKDQNRILCIIEAVNRVLSVACSMVIMLVVVHSCA